MGTKKPEFLYSAEADVMYISFGPARPCISNEASPGVLVRHDLDGRLNGITILDYAARTSGKESE
jgi:hypothetical protein